MPIWSTNSVDEQPTLTLKSWRVVELPDGDRHLVGHCVENQEGRVTSVIRTFDPGALRAVTGTGRVYLLRGRPGINLDAEYVWNHWAKINAISSWTDVTVSAWDAHLATTGAKPEDSPRPPPAPSSPSKRRPRLSDLLNGTPPEAD